MKKSRWVGRVARFIKKRNAYKILIKKTGLKKHIEIATNGQAIILKLIR